MGRRKHGSGSVTERKIVGSMAFTDLVRLALPLVSDEHRALLDLAGLAEFGGAGANEDDFDADRLHQAQGAMAAACRTVIATQQWFGLDTVACPTFARFIDAQHAIKARLTEADIRLALVSRTFQSLQRTGRTAALLRSPGASPAPEIPEPQADTEQELASFRSVYNIAAFTGVTHIHDLKQQLQASHDEALRHAADCPTCQHDATQILGLDWSPF